MASPADTRVAFLGLGIMGRPMAGNLLDAGFSVTVWNRSPEKAEQLAAEQAADVAASPAEAADGAGAVITMVPDSPEVEAVLLGDDGAARGMAEGSLAIDMSTIAPTAARAIADDLHGRGLRFLDAPVTGSRPKAEAGTLTIMAGGEAEDFEQAKPLFEAMGEVVLHVGPQGHGQMTKLINNTVAAINAGALAEAIVTGRAAGLDLDSMRKVISSGSGASAMLELKAGAMIEGELDPLFKLEHMLKDVRHCLAEAEALGVDLPLAREAERLYARAANQGLGGRDFAAVIEVLDRN